MKEATMQESRRILTARDIMATSLVTFRAEQPIFDAIALLLRHGISGAPVVDDGQRGPDRRADQGIRTGPGRRASSTRSKGADVAQRDAVLRELRRERSLRETPADSLKLHLRRLVTI